MRNEETRRKYAGGSGRFGDSMRGRSDAKKRARLEYDYGARSSSKRKAMDRKVASLKKTSDKYSSAYDKAYAKQNHQKLKTKALNNQNRDIVRAKKHKIPSHTVRSAAYLTGAVAGVAAPAVANMALSSKYGSLSPQAAKVLATSTAAVSMGLVTAGMNHYNKKIVESRRKLNYRY